MSVRESLHAPRHTLVCAVAATPRARSAACARCFALTSAKTDVRDTAATASAAQPVVATPSAELYTQLAPALAATAAASPVAATSAARPSSASWSAVGTTMPKPAPRICATPTPDVSSEYASNMPPSDAVSPCIVPVAAPFRAMSAYSARAASGRRSSAAAASAALRPHAYAAASASSATYARIGGVRDVKTVSTSIALVCVTFCASAMQASTLAGSPPARRKYATAITAALKVMVEPAPSTKNADRTDASVRGGAERSPVFSSGWLIDIVGTCLLRNASI